MNYACQQRRKNKQWRIIVWSSLFLIFGKTVGHWIYHILAIDQVYATTTNMVTRVGVADMLATTSPVTSPLEELIIDVKNDTPNAYTIETKVSAGEINFPGNTLIAGETKRFTIQSNTSLRGTGLGDIIFLSAPISGNNNTTCQEIHTLNYDLKYAQQVKQPLVINLSSIASKMDCKENAVLTDSEPDISTVPDKD